MAIFSILIVLSVSVGLAVLAAVTFATQSVRRWDFTTSTVLLTGGSAGIGLETAKELVRRRARHVVIAARREAILRAAVEELEAVKAHTHSPTLLSFVVMDVCDERSVVEGVAAAERQCGGATIDLLICNAGFAYPARFTDCTMKDARDVMNTNYFGCVALIQALLPKMIKAEKGRILLTSSMCARACVAGYTLYAPTKAAVRALAHSVDMESACLGVRAQVASPPDVETPGYETENTAKSPECAKISAFGGSKPFTAVAMARAMVAGIEEYKFDITLGSDGAFLNFAGACMEPCASTGQLLLEVLIAGPVRLGLAVFAKFHYNIVKDVRLGEQQAAASLPKKTK